MSFRNLGERIGAAAIGMSNLEFDNVKQAAMSCDVEHEDPAIRETSTRFCRCFCDAMADMEKKANGSTPDYFLLKKLASQEVWIREFQDLADEFAQSIVIGKEVAEAEDIQKAAAAIGSLVPAVTGRAFGATPTLIKSLLAAGIGTGATAGSLYWALQRSATEDSDDKLAMMQAKIDEYNKMKTMLAESSDNAFMDEEAAMQKRIDSTK